MKSPTPPLLQTIWLRNFLSYGPDAVEIPLQRLNVLIGPNGSGKSNLTEAISLLAAVPGELPKPVREGGGVREWLWKGEGALDHARVEVVFSEGAVVVDGKAHRPIRYRLDFREIGDSFVIADERIEDAQADEGKLKPFVFFGVENGRPMLSVRGQEEKRELKKEEVNPTLSILAQRKDPDAYPELTRLGELLGATRLYRHWFFGPDSPVRLSCRADVRTDRLEAKLDNLPARLLTLKRHQVVKKRILEALSRLSESFTDIEVSIEGGQLRLFVVEPGREVPASRLSDGTLRFLCLLAILLDPAPPPLIVLEEPELGLHPDLMPTLAELLQTASETSQIIVTTHSDSLVSALSETPEAVLVCERREGRTTIDRLSKEKLAPWLARYRLGQLWMRGDLGGTRF